MRERTARFKLYLGSAFLSVFWLLSADCVIAFEQTVIQVGESSGEVQIHAGQDGHFVGDFWLQTGTGDLNGDGRNEMVIVSSQYTMANANGIISIFDGSKSLPNTIVLAENPGDTAIEGPWEKSLLGGGFAIDDFDKDGIDDLFFLARVTSKDTKMPSGAIYMFNGNPDFFRVKHREAAEADMIIQGEPVRTNNNSIFYSDYGISTAFAFGDVNGDGYKDMVLGNDAARRPFQSAFGTPGRVFIVFGREEWPSGLTLGPNTVDVDIYGEVGPKTRLGRTVETGDLNGDGIDELIAMAYGWGEDFQGKGHIFLGKKEWPSVIDLEREPANISIINAPPQGHLGHSLAVSDLNGDGFNDFLFSSFAASSKGRAENGVGYILFGRAAFPAIIDLPTEPRLTAIHGLSTHHSLGYMVKSGDYNGDGMSDLLLSGVDHNHLDEADNGYAAMFYGRNNWPHEIDLNNGEFDILYKSGPQNAAFGAAAYLTDLNQDGSDDLVISDMGYKNYRGMIYLFYGPTQACTRQWKRLH
ncbi:hypothetical protein GF373_14235 [bacterium]|nr:hypothetical protein [bacterium]